MANELPWRNAIMIMSAVSSVGRNDLPKASGGGRKDCHLKPSLEVVCDEATGQYTIKLPGGEVQCPGKPKWLETMERINAILDGSAHPRELRKLLDRIDQVATSSYNASNLEFKPGALSRLVRGISDPGMLKDLERIYEMRLSDETESTYRSGAFAGSRCSEMHKYGAILEALRGRIKEL